MLEVPAEHRRYFQFFVEMSSKTRERVIGVLRKAKSPLSLSCVGTTLAKLLRTDESMGKGLLSVLVSLYGTYQRIRFTPERFAAQVMSAAKSLPVKLTKAQWRDLERQVKEILTMDEPLGVTSKAIEISTDYERPFSEGKVITDVRPIFHSNPSMKPTAAALVHVLKIKYFEEDEEKEIFFALNSSDIVDLQTELSRATTKEETLRGYFKETGLSIWELADNDNGA